MSGRKIRERVLVTGMLVLETPAHLGNGDAESLTDMPLLRDPVEGKPLLTGTSIAGALRAYLREVELGYGKTETRVCLARQLFGAVEGQASQQSWLIVDDALGETPGVEIRDGVSIDPETGTASDQAKYDVELLQAGSTFPLHFELVLDDSGQPLKRALALALRGLEEGEIRLGMRKRRGLGRCSLREWQVCCYDLCQPAGLVAWLAGDESRADSGPKIGPLLGMQDSLPDARTWFELEGTFSLVGSLLVRSAGEDAADPDSVPQRSWDRVAQKKLPIVPGSSVAGALRARALRIAKTLHGDKGNALVDEMFGPRIGDSDDVPQGSRVLVEESTVQGTAEWVQQRVKIDRFTGGAYPQALFAEQPLFETPDSTLQITLHLRKPASHEIGLLLLVLKDLWTGDLPLGGERSVGRGRLQGKEAKLCLHRPEPDEWSVSLTQAQKGALSVEHPTDWATLEECVEALHKWTPGRNNG